MANRRHDIDRVMRRFLLIGNPENRRVKLLQQALEQQGEPPAIVISYRQLLDAPDRLTDLPDEPLIIRQDSCGEDFEVERGLLHLGYEPAAKAGHTTLAPAQINQLNEERGRIVFPWQTHLGFMRLQSHLEAAYQAHPNWRVLTPSQAIRDLFDKRVTSRAYRELGIHVPQGIEGIENTEHLLETMDQLGMKSVFIKLSSSSSASCLGLLRGKDRPILMTTVRARGDRWHNSLRLQRVADPAAIGTILDVLIREGSQIEEAVPKAQLDGRFFDCRMLVVKDEVAFTVVRTNNHPITNLHLGGTRGSLDGLRTLCPPQQLALAQQMCVQATQHHGCFALGVDVLFRRGTFAPMIIEANAFGDLLPNLERDGMDVYQWQIHQLQTRYARAP